MPYLHTNCTTHLKIVYANANKKSKWYFNNTFSFLQFFVSLYGHKLPVLCMDISYDSTIICTGSADRNVKIWGLDFGDCHKSLFAHDDTVTGLKFVPKTHYFFTCGKDGSVKQWDADSYERILTLQVSILNEKVERVGEKKSESSSFVQNAGCYY